MRQNIALLAGLIFLAGCAGSEKVLHSQVLPVAEGQVKCGKADNDNTSVDLEVRHLADPGELTPPGGAYVVWTRSNKDAVPQNIGELKVSKGRDGRLETVTPQRQFEIFVTTEAAGNTTTPVGSPLLWANCSR